MALALTDLENGAKAKQGFFGTDGRVAPKGDKETPFHKIRWHNFLSNLPEAETPFLCSFRLYKREKRMKGSGCVCLRRPISFLFSSPPTAAAPIYHSSVFFPFPLYVFLCGIEQAFERVYLIFLSLLYVVPRRQEDGKMSPHVEVYCIS